MSLFSQASARHALMVNVVAGLYAGILIASVGLVTQFVADLTNCNRYDSTEKCDATRHSKCVWRTDVGQCEFENWEAACGSFSTNECPVSTGACYVKFSSKGTGACRHIHGWGAVELGLFAGVFILGGMIGSPLSSAVLQRFGRPKSIGICGIMAIVGIIVEVLAWELNSYYLNVASRLASGTAMGMMYVIAPLYVSEVAPKEARQTIGVCFQAWLCVAATSTAGIGLAVNPVNNRLGASTTMRWMTMYHVLAALPGAGFVALAFIVQESPVWLRSKGVEALPVGSPSPSLATPTRLRSKIPVVESQMDLASENSRAFMLGDSNPESPNALARPVTYSIAGGNIPSAALYVDGGSDARATEPGACNFTAVSESKCSRDRPRTPETAAADAAGSRVAGYTMTRAEALPSMVDLVSAAQARETPGQPGSPSLGVVTSAASPPPQLTVREMARLAAFPCLVAAVLSVAEQFTGVNAIVSFAPSVMELVGVEPMLGLFIVMATHLVTSFTAVPIASRVSTRSMYLGGLALATPSAVLIGVAAMPGWIPNNTASTVIGLVGIFLFTLGFEAGMGASFFVLSQSIFPQAVRSVGCSFTLCFQFTLNLAMNVGFPVAREGLSGGPSGNQNKGQGILFLLFGAVGVVTWAFLFFTLRPVADSEEADNAASVEVREPIAELAPVDRLGGKAGAEDRAEEPEAMKKDATEPQGGQLTRGDAVPKNVSGESDVMSSVAPTACARQLQRDVAGESLGSLQKGTGHRPRHHHHHHHHHVYNFHEQHGRLYTHFYDQHSHRHQALVGGLAAHVQHQHAHHHQHRHSHASRASVVTPPPALRPTFVAQPTEQAVGRAVGVPAGSVASACPSSPSAASNARLLARVPGSDRRRRPESTVDMSTELEMNGAVGGAPERTGAASPLPMTTSRLPRATRDPASLDRAGATSVSAPSVSVCMSTEKLLQ